MGWEELLGKHATLTCSIYPLEMGRLRKMLAAGTIRVRIQAMQPAMPASCPMLYLQPSLPFPSAMPSSSCVVAGRKRRHSSQIISWVAVSFPFCFILHFCIFTFYLVLPCALCPLNLPASSSLPPSLDPIPIPPSSAILTLLFHHLFLHPRLTVQWHCCHCTIYREMAIKWPLA